MVSGLIMVFTGSGNYLIVAVYIINLHKRRYMKSHSLLMLVRKACFGSSLKKQ